MRRIAALALVLALAGAAAPVGAGERAASPNRLRAFENCGELLRYAKRHGVRTVGPWGFGGPVATGVAVGAPATERAAAPPRDHSTTNVQEAGVDEPDIVKSDGERILALAHGKLHYVDVSSPRPRLRDTLKLGDGLAHEMLVAGDRALVVSRSGGVVPLPGPGVVTGIAPSYEERTVLTEVAVGDGTLRVLRTLSLDAGYLSARLTGSTARVVVRTRPDVGLEHPAGETPEERRAAEARNEQAVASSSLAAWLPRYELVQRRTGRVKRAYLVNCRSVRRPARFSGLGLVTVLTLDLTKGIDPVDRDSVMTNGEIVYASPDSLYVATQTWVDPAVVTEKRDPPTVETALHAFDAPAAARTNYRATGRVTGYLLNQWSLSEHGGKLRVASTTMPLWWPTTERAESESMVTVLEPRAGRLVPVGRVGGLGRGERIHGVRFIGDTGYVVTFRQVDPLYTIDLSVPEKPVVRGELKILGYSAYLHPVGDDLLLGVGQDATDEGRALGTQVSLFDVSDLRRPARLDRLTLPGGSSEAEWDHRAFLWWPKARLAVIPVVTYARRGGDAEIGAVAVRVSRTGVARAGRLEHEAKAPIRRTLVVEGTLYTVSDAGLEASDLGSFADRGWIPF